MVKKEDSKELLIEADKLRKRAVDRLQNEVLEDVGLLRVELENVAEHLRGETLKQELADELRKLIPTVERLLGRITKTRTTKRATKVSLAEKTDWLKDRLQGGKSESKGKLVEEFAKSRGMKNSPTLLDKPLRDNPELFTTRTEGRNVFVSLRGKQ